MNVTFYRAKVSLYSFIQKNVGLRITRQQKEVKEQNDNIFEKSLRGPKLINSPDLLVKILHSYFAI